jgi:ABC-type proline/glycine betaine transport system permease subunit
VSSFDKKKERWNRKKSKGKKRYVLKTLLIWEVWLLLITIVYVFVFKRTELTNIPIVIFSSLMTIIILSPLGVWIGNNSWNANMRRFEK